MSAKRKLRSTASSGIRVSPEEKRARKRSCGEIQVECEGDTVLEALTIAEDLAKKVDMILTKLGKLDTI